MGLIREFKEFALKGSVVDLAVGVILGAAFATVVKSFTEDVLMPPVTRLSGTRDLSDHFIALDGHHYDTLAQAKAAAAATINYGVFIGNIITFLIVAFCIFLVVKAINKLKRPSPTAEPVAKDCPACAMSIPIKATRCPHCTTDLSSVHA